MEGVDDLTASRSGRGPVDDVRGITRRLARGADPATLLAQLVGIAARSLGTDVAGVWEQATSRWHVAAGAAPSIVRRLERAAGEPSRPGAFVVAVPLTDEGRLLGRFVVERPSAAQAAGAELDIGQLVEAVTLALVTADAPAASASQSAVAAEMRRDLAAGRFVAHFQPILELSSRTVVAFESLARWNHPARGWVGAAEFMPTAEQSDLVSALDAVVFERAAERARRWLERGAKRVRVNLKVSHRHLDDDGFVPRLQATIDRHRLPAQTLGLLIPEPFLLAAAHRMPEIRGAHVRIAVERVGTANVPIATLRSLPLYALKIDRSIVSGLGDDPAARMRARSIVQTARSLDLRTIAEGVETELQREIVAELGCDAALGYLWSPAVEPEVADSMLRFQPFREPARRALLR